MGSQTTLSTGSMGEGERWMVGQPILLRSLKSSGGTESTGGGARSMAADDVVRSMCVCVCVCVYDWSANVSNRVYVRVCE